MLNKHAKDIANFLRAGDYQETDSGLLIHGAIMACGEYFESVNGQDERRSKNLVPTEGITFILNVALGASSKSAAFYLAPFAGAVTPAANWTAANFAATASEIVSQTEGFAGTSRLVWTPSAAAAGSIDNLSAKASFNILTASSLNINGAALLTDQARGATTGALISATKFAATRVVYNGDVWDCGYRLTLTDS